MKHYWLLSASVMKLFLVVAMMTGGVKTAAADGYTTSDLTAAGWTQVTTAEALSSAAANGNLFILLDTRNTQMAVARTSEPRPVYKTLTEPRKNPGELWYITPSGENYEMRNLNKTDEYAYTTASASWNMFFTTDHSDNQTKWKFTLAGGKWSINNVDLSTVVGHWDDNTNAAHDGEGIAANKSVSDGYAAGFYIYTANTLDLLSAASESNPLNATFLIQNPSFETGNTLAWDFTWGNASKLDGDVGARTTDSSNDPDYSMTNSDGNYLLNIYQWWASYFTASQTVTGVPYGVYDVSGVVAAWNGHEVIFSANSAENTVSATGAATGYTSTHNNLQITNGQLTVSATSAVDWWTGYSDTNPAPEDQKITFFKLDNVQLICKGLYLSNFAIPLPNDTETELAANQWYYFDVAAKNNYRLSGNYSGMVYTADGNQVYSDVTAGSVTPSITLSAGRVYFKAAESGKTLLLTQTTSTSGKEFKVCALNVDGMPTKILSFEVNGDGPGEDGSVLIGQYLREQGIDIMGLSEDFNHNGSLQQGLDPNGDDDSYLWHGAYPDNTDAHYYAGKFRGSIAVGGGSAGLGGLAHFDTDGLMFYSRAKSGDPDHDFPYIYEDFWEWDNKDGSVLDGSDGQFDELIEKGFRYYQVQIAEGFNIDVFILHMDAGSRDGDDGVWDGDDTEARNAQWTELANYITTKCDNGRPKIVLGDTNSRYTRDKIKLNFFTPIEAGGKYSVSDCWVEKKRGGVYPEYHTDALTTGGRNDATCEIVDKILYINPTSSVASMNLTLKDFIIDETNYKYPSDYSDESKRGKLLGDHCPLIATFVANIDAIQPTDNSLWFEGEYFEEDHLTRASIAFDKGSVKTDFDHSKTGLRYLFNVGIAMNDGSGIDKRYWLADNGYLVSDPVDAFPWAFVWQGNDKPGYNIWNSQDYYLYMNKYLADWYTGITSEATKPNPRVGKDRYSATRIHVYKAEDLTYSGQDVSKYRGYAYVLKNQSTNKYFNIAADENMKLTAADNRWNQNDWYFISAKQVDAYNAYVSAFNNAKHILSVPLPEEYTTELMEALQAGSDTYYSECIDNGENKGVTTRLKEAYNNALAYLQNQDNYIAYDMNDPLNGLLDSDTGAAIANTKGIANPSFEDVTESTENPPAPNNWTVSNSKYAYSSSDMTYHAFDGRKGSRVFNAWKGNDSRDNVYPTDPDAKYIKTGFWCYQTIADVPAGYYILSANFTSKQLPEDNLIDYQKHVVYLLYGTSEDSMQPQYNGTVITNERPGNNVAQAVIYHNGGNFILGAYSRTWFEVDYFKLMRYDDHYPVKMTDSQFSSLCLPITVSIPSGSGIKAYRAEKYYDNNGSPYTLLKSIDQDALPAKTPVILRAMPVTTFKMAYDTDSDGNITAAYYVKTDGTKVSVKDVKEDTDTSDFQTETTNAIAPDKTLIAKFLKTSGSAAAVSDNMLHGNADGPKLSTEYYNSIEAAESVYDYFANYTTRDDSEGTYYVLTNRITKKVGDEKVTTKYDTGFYKLATSNKWIPRFRAYTIVKDEELKAKGYVLLDIDETSETDGILQPETGITAQGQPTTAAIYSANGTRQNSLQRGLNIVRMPDGTVRKVMIR